MSLTFRLGRIPVLYGWKAQMFQHMPQSSVEVNAYFPGSRLFTFRPLLSHRPTMPSRRIVFSGFANMINFPSILSLERSTFHLLYNKNSDFRQTNLSQQMQLQQMPSRPGYFLLQEPIGVLLCLNSMPS